MPGVLLDTQTVSSPFDRCHLHHHQHYPFHGSPPPPLSSTTTCSIAITPTSSASVQEEDPSPDSPPHPLRFGDLPPNSFASSPPPGFILHPLGIHDCYSPPSMHLCSSPGLSHSPRLVHLDVREEVGEKVFSRTLSKLGGSGVFPVNGEVGFNGSQAKEDGDCAGALASFEASSGCASGEIYIPDAVMAAAGAGNCGTSAAGVCLVGSPVFPDAITALQKFLPSNNEEDDEQWPMDSWPAMDVYSCDEFRMYEFKVRRCMRGRSHDWTECPFAHPGEKARRRDPRKFHYSGTACPDFRKGSCKRGETCDFAHGVFECWLHPARYRTQPCKDGRSCRRRVCFFSHTAEQLRVLPVRGCAAGGSPPASLASSPVSSARSSVLKAALSGGAYDGSPLRQALAGSLDGTLALELLYEQGFCKAATGHTGGAGLCYSAAAPSPTSTLLGSHSLSPPSPSSSASSSPPLSPSSSPSSAWPRSSAALPSPSAHLRHLERLHSLPTVWNSGFDDRNLVHLNLSPDIHSPRSVNELISTLQQLQLKARPVEPCRVASFPWSFPQYSSRSVPGTPRSRCAYQDDHRDANEAEAEAEPAAQRVESRRDSRVKLSAKSTNENPVEHDAPDFDWVNELVK